jgi:ubiquinone/menaquinone biosynthesis C-methylase UbiE
VQDAFIMSRLKTIQGKRILEVGGGSPRVLKILAKENECWLVDKFEGVGRGPKDIPRIKPIKIVQGYMGEHLDVLPTRYFDIIFSISVVEHIPIERLEAFFRDCGRVLKPGGKMLHAIDTYTFDSPQERLNRPFQDRLAAYLQFANRPDLGIRLTEAPAIDAGLEFSCQYATLPDNVMHEWYLNRKDDKRLRGQVVSVKSEWEKLAEQETE